MHVAYWSATAADKWLLAHESQQTLKTDIAETDETEFSDEADMLPQVSETNNNSELEADSDVSHATRKRKRNPEKLARNIRKKKAHIGEAKKSTCEYEVAATTPRSQPLRCTSSKGSEFSEEERLELCMNYWPLSDYSNKNNGLLNHVIEFTVFRRRTYAMDVSRKGRSLQWYFPKSDNSLLRVCNFFCSTIDIGKCVAPVMLALCNKN